MGVIKAGHRFCSGGNSVFIFSISYALKRQCVTGHKEIGEIKKEGGTGESHPR